MQQLLQQMAEIKDQVMLNTSLLHEIVRRQRGMETAKVGKLPINCQLPLKSFEAVLAMEQQLKSKEVYSQLVSETCDFVC